MAVLPTTYERRWPSVILTPIAVANHIITVSVTNGLHTKQKITLRLGGNVLTDLEIKRVLSDTEIQVGPIGSEMGNIINPVAYNGGTLEMQEQERNKIDNPYTMRAVYEEEPAVALRNVLVDRYGAFYSTDHPLPVQLSDGDINIGTLNADLEVQLSHKDNDPDAGDVHDSVRIGDGKDEMAVNDDGSINVQIVTGANGAVVPTFNQISAVPANAFTNLVTYTVPPLKKGYLYRVNFGGDNIAEYEVYLNGGLVGKTRTWFSGPLFDKLEWSSPNGAGLSLVAGDVILVKVQHYRPTAGTFEGTVLTVITDV